MVELVASWHSSRVEERLEEIGGLNKCVDWLLRRLGREEPLAANDINVEMTVVASLVVTTGFSIGMARIDVAR